MKEELGAVRRLYRTVARDDTEASKAMVWPSRFSSFSPFMSDVAALVSLSDSRFFSPVVSKGFSFRLGIILSSTTYQGLPRKEHMWPGGRQG